MIFFPKDTIHIYEEIRSQEKCGMDMYGKPLKCRVKVDTVRGDLQTVSSNEIRYIFGTIDQGTHILYLNHTVKIKSTYLLEVEGYAGFFEIVGNPKKYDKFLRHLEVLLKHREG